MTEARVEAAIKRLWAQVTVSDGCWQFAGRLNRDGYGEVNVGPAVRRAHRIAYETLVGPIPEGLVIDHTCHNEAAERARAAGRKVT